VISTLQELSESDLVRVMTEPKNAIVKQYEAYFDLEGAKLEFTDEALRAIAKEVIDRGTGVRALRSVFENILLEIRYELPENQEMKSFVVTREMVEGRQAAALRRLKGAGRKRESA
jgi:ATP-dependent Clp protease ATP-binding subunit ClpX